MKRRFFSFGCSYTAWYWPTWADLIGEAFLENHYNYGHQGAGNMYIFNSLMEADQRHHFTKDDLVIVQWSSVTREDRYMDRHWNTQGNVLTYGEDFVMNYFDYRGFLIRDLALIKAAKHFLSESECEHYMLSMIPLANADHPLPPQPINEADYSDVVELYSNVINDILPSFKEVLDYHRPITLPSGFRTVDNHPLPRDHYDFIKLNLPQYLPDLKIVDDYEMLLGQVTDAWEDRWIFTKMGQARLRSIRL